MTSAHPTLFLRNPDFFHTIFDVSNEAILIHDAETGEVLDCNKRFCEMFGYSNTHPKQISLENICSEQGEFTAETVRQKFLQAKRYGAQIFPWLAKHRQDKTFWVEINFKRVVFDDIPYIVTFIHDISDIKLADRSLLESEKKWRTLAQNVPDIIMMVDQQEKILFINHIPAGYNPKDIIGSSILGFQSPQYYMPMRQCLQNVFKSSQLVTFEHVAAGKPGQWRYYSSRLTPIREDNAVTAVLVVSTDVTEQKQAQQALQKSEEKFSKAFYSSPDAIMITRRSDGKILEFNEGLTRITGYSQQEVIGRTTQDLNLWIHPAQRKSAISLLEREQRVRDFEAQIRTKSGDNLVCLISMEQIEIDNTPCIVSISRDITKQKQAETSLLHSQDALKERNSSLAAINKIADRVYRARDMQTVAKEAVEAMLQYTASKSVAFFLLNNERQVLELICDTSVGARRSQIGVCVPLRDSLNGIALNRKTVICSSNFKDDTRFNQHAKEPLLEEGYHSVIAVPLLFKDQALGAINIFFHTSYRISENEKQTLQSIGKTIGLAVANARYVSQLQREMQERQRAEETLRNIAIGVSAATGNDFFRSLVNNIAHTFDLDYAFLGKYQPAENNIIKTIAVHAHGEIAENFTYPLNDTPCQKMLVTNECFYPQSVQRVFPKDTLLKKVGAESFIGTPLHDSAGMVLGFFVVLDSKPITNPELIVSMLQIFAVRAAAEIERLNAEHALRRSEEHLRLAIAASGIATWEWDIAADRLTWSDNAGRIFHRQPQKTMTCLEEYLRLVLDEDKQLFHQSLQAALRSNKTYHCEHRVLLNKNTIHWMSMLGEIYRNSDNKAVRMRGTVSDITQRKEAENQLLASQKMLQLVFNSIPARVFWKDLDLHFIGCNQLFAKDAGLPNPEHIAGKTDFDMPWAKQADMYRQVEQQIIASGKPKLNYVEKQLSDNGKTVWLETSKIPLTDAQGKIIGVLGTYSDITARIEATQELKKYRERLEELVAKRTQELTQVNHELEAFSYSVSHDLRTPLRAIDGFSLALIEDYYEQLDDTAKDYLARVRSGAQRMAQLIDDLLKLSRLTRGELNHDQIQLNLIVEEIAAKLRALAPDRSVEFQIATDAHAFGDEGLLSVVLENLINNAWKYTGKRDHSIIRFNHHETPEEFIFCVEDNGVGFNMNYRNKLFGAFQRLHRHDEFEGNGIGLATVARIIHRHGGRVWAEGEENKGARFYFSLPKGVAKNKTSE